jgi:tRNA nucleotidyltransferase (CCA-adding enzyme)
MKKLQINIPPLLDVIIKTISAHEGKCYLVGGAVIDSIYKNPIKDWDIEVFNKSYKELLLLLQRFGDCNLIGKKFGVIKFRKDNFDAEFSIPRLENKVGPGHKDFSVELTPSISITEAAKRRDFTINAIYLDLTTNELNDPFSGLKDLKKSQLRLVNWNTFEEDPLRVFRAMQLVSRKVKYITLETKNKCTSMIEELKNLSKDSIYQEWVKMLMLGDRPDLGIKFLDDTNILSLYPELENLKGIQQSPKWHKEGDAFVHTQMVTKAAARIRHKIPEDWRLAFMFASVVHDVGKAISTQIRPDGKITSYNHDTTGVKIAEQFMRRLTDSEDLINKVNRIVYDHMRPRLYLNSNTKMRTWRRAQNRCPLNIIAYFTVADNMGRIGEDETKGLSEFKGIMKKWIKFGRPKDKIRQVLQGKDLIDAGYEPGIEFTEYLNNAYRYQINTGCENKEELIKHIKG